MGIDHAWEKFYSAIRIALVSSGSPQERLSSLISSTWDLERDSFPDEHIWDDFRKLVNEATKKGTGEGKIQAITSQMSDEKAKACLEAAFEIFSDVAKAFGRTEFVI